MLGSEERNRPFLSNQRSEYKQTILCFTDYTSPKKEQQKYGEMTQKKGDAFGVITQTDSPWFPRGSSVGCPYPLNHTNFSINFFVPFFEIKGGRFFLPIFPSAISTNHLPPVRIALYGSTLFFTTQTEDLALWHLLQDPRQPFPLQAQSHEPPLGPDASIPHRNHQT